MEKCEIVYVDDIAKDFLKANLTEKKVIAIDDKLNVLIAPSPLRRTENILGVPAEYNLRKARFGDYRMFMEVDMVGFIITCLSFLHRSKCYDKKNVEKAISILQKEKVKKEAVSTE